MNNYTYLTTHSKYPLKHFFASLTPEQTEYIINSNYSLNFINSQIEKFDDSEEAIIFLLYILQNQPELVLTDLSTGEIISQIPLTPETLEKNPQDFLPVDFINNYIETLYKEVK